MPYLDGRHQENLRINLELCCRWLVYRLQVAFSDLTDADLATAREEVAAAALRAARRAATSHLLTGLPAELGDLDEVVDVLVARNTGDYRHELLRAFEKPWALLVIRLIATVANPVAAVRDARDRGATVPEIASTLDMTPQGVYAAYGDAVRRPRRS
jgi:hypothetical protein